MPEGKNREYTVSLWMLPTSPSLEVLPEEISMVVTGGSAAISGNSMTGNGLNPSEMALEERRGWGARGRRILRKNL